jgi:uncharacterized phage protein (TIGR01671 family)
MKEILFQGKRVDNGKWAAGFLKICRERPNRTAYFIMDNTNTVCNEPEIWHLVDPLTVGQFTGLTDKNGKNIFEGDVLKYDDDLLIVGWDVKMATVCLTKKGWMFKHFFNEAVNVEECEIVGNIHDKVEK